MENITFEELLNNTLKEISVGQTVTGKIVNISSKGEIFVDIGYKSDGIIPKSEFSSNEDENPSEKFKIGDRITSIVLKLNDGIGNVLLSYKRARYEIDKKEFESKVNNNFIFKEKVSEVTDSGLIVNVNNIKIFIPMSLAGIPRGENANDYKGKEICFRVIEYNEKTRKIIGSVKQVIDEEKKIKQDKFWNTIDLEKSYKGIVTSISSYGAFVDLDGVQGLLHISEMTWERNKKPSDILEVGQEIKVKIKNADKENRRLMLIYDKKGPDPWELVGEKYKINDVVKVKVIKLMPFGVFVQVDKGIEGLVHISQISEKKIAKPEDILKIGQKVNAKIIDISKENRKLELSIRELEGTSDEYIG